MLNQRSLLEKLIISEECDQKVLDWCATNSSFSHSDQDEYIFWVPPLDGLDTYMKTAYGLDIPKEIEEAIRLAAHQRSTQPDSGYLIIAFI